MARRGSNDRGDFRRSRMPNRNLILLIVFLSMTSRLPSLLRRTMTFVFVFLTTVPVRGDLATIDDRMFNVLDVVWRLEIAFKQYRGRYDHTRFRARDPLWRIQWESVIIEFETALWAALQALLYDASTEQFVKLMDLAHDRKVRGTQMAKRVLGV